MPRLLIVVGRGQRGFSTQLCRSAGPATKAPTERRLSLPPIARLWAKVGSEALGSSRRVRSAPTRIRKTHCELFRFERWSYLPLAVAPVTGCSNCHWPLRVHPSWIYQLHAHLSWDIQCTCIKLWCPVTTDQLERAKPSECIPRVCGWQAGVGIGHGSPWEARGRAAHEQLPIVGLADADEGCASSECITSHVRL